MHSLTCMHTHTCPRSHAHTLTRSHAHTLTRSHAHALTCAEHAPTQPQRTQALYLKELAKVRTGLNSNALQRDKMYAVYVPPPLRSLSPCRMRAQQMCVLAGCRFARPFQLVLVQFDYSSHDPQSYQVLVWHWKSFARVELNRSVSVTQPHELHANSVCVRSVGDANSRVARILVLALANTR
jgi:hypothetical protein